MRELAERERSKERQVTALNSQIESMTRGRGSPFIEAHLDGDEAWTMAGFIDGLGISDEIAKALIDGAPRHVHGP